MIIRVNRNIWNAMLDFSKGFRKYELETAVKLRGKYSLRIYKLVSKQTTPISYTIADLRKMWGLTDKYKKVDDFIKNTIDAAKKELDSVSPYTFDYVPVFAKSADVNKGRKGRPAISSITFFPKHNLQNESTDAVRKMVDPSMMLDHDLYHYLQYKLDFDQSGIKATISLFDVASHEFNLLAFLDRIAPSANRADNPQGYVIAAIRNHLKDEYGIIFEGNMVLRGRERSEKKAALRTDVKSIREILDTTEEE